jgi:nitrogen regulatory protein P-II 2
MTAQVVLVTIVAESVLEERLLHDLESLGARGWTIVEARGRGPQDRRMSDLAGGSIRVETVVSQASADAIMERLAREYFAQYAVVAWTSPVLVVRTDHYA